MPMTNQELRKIVRVMHVSPNSIVAIKAGTPMAEMETVNGLAKAINESGIRNVFIIVVDDPAHIETVDPAGMSRAGWVRAEAMTRLVNKLAKGNGKV